MNGKPVASWAGENSAVALVGAAWQRLLSPAPMRIAGRGWSDAAIGAVLIMDEALLYRRCSEIARHALRVGKHVLPGSERQMLPWGIGIASM